MSQLESESITIGKYTFKVHKLPWDKAQDVLIDIVQTIGPAMGKTLGAVQKHGFKDLLESDVGDTDASDVIGALATGLSKERMNSLIRTMASVTHCNGQPLTNTMEIVFRGDLPLMYQWLAFALRVNYANFIGWLGGAIKDVIPASLASASQPTSNASGSQ